MPDTEKLMAKWLEQTLKVPCGVESPWRTLQQQFTDAFQPGSIVELHMPFGRIRLRIGEVIEDADTRVHSATLVAGTFLGVRYGQGEENGQGQEDGQEDDADPARVVGDEETQKEGVVGSCTQFDPAGRNWAGTQYG